MLPPVEERRCDEIGDEKGDAVVLEGGALGAAGGGGGGVVSSESPPRMSRQQPEASSHTIWKSENHLVISRHHWNQNHDDLKKHNKM